MMESQTTKQDGDIPGATTRSGRVIKKSTKLMDFAAPDDIETVKAKMPSKKLNMTRLTHIKMEPELDINLVLPATPSSTTEKSSKKKPMKDGKIVMDKAQREDSGYILGYMLWAKGARQSISQSNPELDFASVSKRLTEMWANFPTSFKYSFKRRANRQASIIKKSNCVKEQALQRSTRNSNATSTASASSSLLTIPMKGGKIGMDKVQQEDTAYMSWANGARHSISQSNPELDFDSVSKRLSEMWVNFPANFKRNLKRREANKIKKSNAAQAPAPQQSTPNSNATSTASSSSSLLAKQQKKKLPKDFVVPAKPKKVEMAVVVPKLNIIDTPPLPLPHIKRKPEVDFEQKRPKTDSETESEVETKSKKSKLQLIRNLKKPPMNKISAIPSNRSSYNVPSGWSPKYVLPTKPTTEASNSDLSILGL